MARRREYAERVRILLSLDRGELDRVDVARGKAPRVTWIRSVVRAALERLDKNERGTK